MLGGLPSFTLLPAEIYALSWAASSSPDDASIDEKLFGEVIMSEYGFVVLANNIGHSAESGRNLIVDIQPSGGY
jgi:hypothetical protein